MLCIEVGLTNCARIIFFTFVLRSCMLIKFFLAVALLFTNITNNLICNDKFRIPMLNNTCFELNFGPSVIRDNYSLNSNFPPKLKWLLLKYQSSEHALTNSNSFQIKKSSHVKLPNNKKLALKLGIQTYQILTNYDEVYIPSVSSLLIAV